MKKKLLLLLMISITVLSVVQPISAEGSPDLKEEIIYHLIVDRFNNGDPKLDNEVDIEDPYAFHGGDLEGIIKKLDHIKRLGFTTISLSPIFENAEKGYHGYWIEDHYAIEEQFGSMETLKKLIDEAHKRELKVILELVVNYVAPSHPYVQDPEKTDWFTENDLSLNESTAWLEQVLKFDQSHEEVQQYLLDVAEYWMTETDIDGFRIHAAEQTDESFLQVLTEHIKTMNPDFYLIASVLDYDSEQVSQLKEIPYFDAIENPSFFRLFNDVFSKEEQPVDVLYEAWENEQDQTSVLFVDHQNTARFSYQFAVNGRNNITAWRLALLYLYTTPGVPMVYQGSELAMSGPGFPENQHLVLFNTANPDLEEVFEKMSALRHQFLPILTNGDFELIASDGAMSLFRRTFEDEAIYLAINNDSVTRSVAVPGLSSDQQLRGLIGDDLVRENQQGEFRIGLDRESVEFYIVEENVGLNWGFIGFILGVLLLFIIAVSYLSYKQKKREKTN